MLLIEKMLIKGQEAAATGPFIFAAGVNIYGEYGDGTTTESGTPKQMGTESWQSVSAGLAHRLAIRSDGKLFAWGLNNYGQLGDGTNINKSSPVQIGTDSWVAVSACNYLSAGIKYTGSFGGTAGTLWTWGNNRFNTSSSAPNQWGALGNGNASNHVSCPVQVGAGNTWTKVDVGYRNIAAIRVDCSGFIWGEGRSGMNGQAGGPFTAYCWISQNCGHGGAIDTNGFLWMWGCNTSGQLGDLSTINKQTPVLVGANFRWKCVDVGRLHTLAIRCDNKLFAWGEGTSGKLGNGNNANQSSPVQIGTLSWIAISAGLCVSAGITSTGGLYTWGLGTGGTLGTNSTTSTSSPVQVGTSAWTAVSIGHFNGYAIRSGGGLFAWGCGTCGRLGDGTNITKSSPVQIGTSVWAAVDAGDSHAVAIRSGGNLFTWGLGTCGRLGNSSNLSRSSPVVIGTGVWTSISGGGLHTLALCSSGDVYAWGRGLCGALGDGTVTNRCSPVLVCMGCTGYGQTLKAGVVNPFKFTIVSAGFDSSFALRSNAAGCCGYLFAWGNNSQTQLGLCYNDIGNFFACYPQPRGFTEWSNLSSPTIFGTASSSCSWTAITVGNGLGAGHGIAINWDKKLFTWGDNYGGQIGNGTFSATRVVTPTQIGTSSWIAIGASVGISAGITSTGALYVWGCNRCYALGRGNLTDYCTPQLYNNCTFTSVTPGECNIMAILNNNNVMASGYFYDRTIGINTTSYRCLTTPTMLTGVTDIGKVSSIKTNFKRVVYIRSTT